MFFFENILRVDFIFNNLLIKNFSCVSVQSERK